MRSFAVVDVKAVADRLAEELRELGSAERAEREKAYLRSDLEHFGCSVPVIRRSVKAVLRAQAFDRGGTLGLVAALWDVPVHERRFAAVEVLVTNVGTLERRDVDTIEGYLRQCEGWALLDGLATRLGPWLDQFSDATHVLDRWAVDPDFWIRRAVLLVHLLPLRSGGGDFERFTGYADAMLEEKEFFIRKAIGWVLRDTSRRRPDLVATWSLPRAHRMSGVTVREVVKHLDPGAAAEILHRYRHRPQG